MKYILCNTYINGLISVIEKCRFHCICAIKVDIEFNHIILNYYTS